MSKEIPEWFEKEIRKFIQQHGETYDYIPECSETADFSFKLLTKPENLKKIPEVKELIEAAKKGQKVCSQNMEGDFYEEIGRALKLFESEGE